MPYTVIWLIPDRVIYAHYSGELAEDELRENLQLMNDMMNSSRSSHVHIICDTGDITNSLTSPNPLRISQEMTGHDRIGWVITIREKVPILKMAMASGSSSANSRQRSFKTLEEAEDFLKQVDTTLYWDD